MVTVMVTFLLGILHMKERGSYMMKRKNGEGSWGTKTIKGITYKRFRSPEGKDFYGKTEKEIRQKYKIWKEQYADKNIKKELKTVNDIADEWLESVKKHIKATTYDGYEYFVEGVLKKKNGYDLGNMQIQQVSDVQIQKYIDYLADSIAKSSIKKDKSLLHQVFKYAKKHGVISDNPMEDIKIPNDDNIVKKAKEYVFISTEDWKKLEAEECRVWSNNKRMYGNNAKVVIFLLHTGLRFGELTALKWKNVNLEEKDIFIVENSPIIKNRDINARTKYKVDETTTKRKSNERHIPLSNKAIEILEYFRNKYPHESSDHVFVAENGSLVDRSNVSRCLSGMLKAAKCEVQEASPHDLRHSFGSELIKNGIDIKVVSELMGHKDVQTTYNIYIHILKEQKVDAVSIFNR